MLNVFPISPGPGYGRRKNEGLPHGVLGAVASFPRSPTAVKKRGGWAHGFA